MPGSVLAQEERTVGSITQTFDGKIELRQRADGCQIRVRGLLNKPEGWHPFEPRVAPDEYRIAYWNTLERGPAHPENDGN